MFFRPIWHKCNRRIPGPICSGSVLMIVKVVLLSRRNVEFFCHKHFVDRLPWITNNATCQRWVSSTCHGPVQLCVSHLAVDASVGWPCRNFANFDTHKTIMIGLSYGEKNYDNMLRRFHRIPERDGQTDRQNCSKIKLCKMYFFQMFVKFRVSSTTV